MTNDEIRQESLNYVEKEIDYACKNFKNRSAGSENERKCQDHFLKEMGTFCDATHKESFKVAPKAFLGSLTVSAILGIISSILFWVGLKVGHVSISIVGGFFGLLAFTIMLFEFVFYWRFIDIFFPKKTSHNVYGIILPKGEIKKRIILSAHSDAAHEMRYSLIGNGKLALLVGGGSFVGMIYLFFANVAYAFRQFLYGGNLTEPFWQVIGTIELIFIPFFIALLFYINWKVVVDGANDNLSGCLVAIAYLREMKKRGVRYEDTEVCCLLTGSEEAGIRGSLAFGEMHKEKDANVETIFVVLDTLLNTDHLKIYEEGQNGLQKNDASVSSLIRKAGNKVGIKLEKAGFFPGATDAEGFSRYGFKASSVCAIEHKPQIYYHTRHDTFENINKECLNKTLELVDETVKLYASGEKLN